MLASLFQRAWLSLVEYDDLGLNKQLTMTTLKTFCLLGIRGR